MFSGNKNDGLEDLDGHVDRVIGAHPTISRMRGCKPITMSIMQKMYLRAFQKYGVMLGKFQGLSLSKLFKGYT